MFTGRSSFLIRGAGKIKRHMTVLLVPMQSPIVRS